MRIKLSLLVALAAAALFAPAARSQDIFGDLSQGLRDQQRYNRDLGRLNSDLLWNNWGRIPIDAAQIGQDQRRLYYDRWRLRSDLQPYYPPVVYYPPRPHWVWNGFQWVLPPQPHWVWNGFQWVLSY